MINNQTINSGAAVSSQKRTILDVMLEWKVVDQKKVELMSNLTNNLDIENFLLGHKLTDRVVINRAYAHLFNLQYINLQDQTVDLKVVKLIKEEFCRKYFLLPYSYYVNSVTKRKVIRIALGMPGMLRGGNGQNSPGVISNLKKSQNADIEMVIASPDEIISILNDVYQKNNFVVEKKVDLKKVTVPVNILSRFPEEVARKYRMVVFENSNPLKINVAAENPKDKKVIDILNFIKKRSKFDIDLFRTDRDSIDHVLMQYNPQVKGDLNLIKEDTLKNINSVAPGKAEELFSSFGSIGQPNSQVIFPKPQVDNIPLKPNANQDIDSKKNIKTNDFWSDDKPESAQKNQTKTSRDLLSVDPHLIEIDKNASKKTVDETETSEEEKRQKELDRFNSLGGQLVKSNQAAQKNIVKPEMAAAPTQDMQNDELVVKDEHEMQVAEMKSLEKELTLRSESDLSSVLKEEVSSEDQLKKIIDSATIPVIVAAMINFALHKRASDIHIEPTEKEVRLRFRIDGILYDIMSMPRYFRSALISRVKIMSKLKIDEQRVPQDGRFDVVFSKQKIDVRVSTLPTIFGEKVAMRLLDKSAGLYTLEELGLSGSNLKRLEENILKPYGIILATGPTGSGKSTTLYAILKRISNPSVNIITLEDPVEYEIPGVNQCLVKPKIGFSFAEGLRSVLRQDPNIIMVGEIRDSETANLGVQAAMTGHLVLSSLHTNNASGAIPRLVNMKVEPFLITSTVSAIIAQRLVRRICQHCKQEVKLHQEVEMKVRSALENLQGTDSLPANLEYKFYQGKGCSECHLGYAGRIGLYEIMVMSDELEKLTVQNRPTSEIEAQAVKEGMITMFQDGLIKAMKGITTIDEVFRETKLD
ncbi:MAG: ATPase, T2SS/T4P/T4SS family [Patescibacteria group bacterium]